jgi:hypothetical protein
MTIAQITTHFNIELPLRVNGNATDPELTELKQWFQKQWSAIKRANKTKCDFDESSTNVVSMFDKYNEQVRNVVEQKTLRYIQRIFEVMREQRQFGQCPPEGYLNVSLSKRYRETGDANIYIH